MTQAFSEIHIYEHYLNVVRQIINIKLTVLHTLMLRTAFFIFHFISFIWPTKGKVSGSEKPEGCTWQGLWHCMCHITQHCQHHIKKKKMF